MRMRGVSHATSGARRGRGVLSGDARGGDGVEERRPEVGELALQLLDGRLPRVRRQDEGVECQHG